MRDSVYDPEALEEWLRPEPDPPRETGYISVRPADKIIRRLNSEGWLERWWAKFTRGR